MKHKSLIAVAAALTLALSSMTALAAPTVVTDASGGNSQTVNGDVNYVNTEVFRVTLPTTDGMSFTLDPQGLLAVSTGDSSTYQAGMVVGTGKMTAINESSVDINLTSSFYVTDSDDSAALTLVGSDVSVNDDAKQLKLVIDD